MLNSMLKKIRQENLNKVSSDSDRHKAEKRLDAMSNFLISRFSYEEEAIKGILRGAIQGKFDIDSAADRDKLLSTLSDVIMLEVVNKHNSVFIELTNQLRSPIVVVMDLTQIVLNSAQELQPFITSEERSAVMNFNEEAKYVRDNFGV